MASECPWDFSDHTQGTSNSTLQTLSQHPPRREGMFLELRTSAKRAPVDEDMLFFRTSRWKKKKKKKVYNCCCLGHRSHFAGCGFTTYSSAIYLPSLWVPVIIRWNPTVSAGEERIKSKQWQFEAVFVARRLIGHSGYKFKYELKLGSSNRSHTIRKCCFFSLHHNSPSSLRTAEESTGS